MASSKQLEFIFDFASPNAYFCFHALPPILARTGAELIITPCLLGGIFKDTGNQAPMIQFANIKGKLDYDMLETRRFIEKHGLTKMKMNPHFPVNTVQIMRGHIAARRLGVEQKYIDTVLKAMWEDGEKMDDADVILSVLNKAGLNGGEIMGLTKDQSVKDELFANTKNAVERGAFGIPTFYIGNEMFFGKERLGQVEEMLAA